MTPARANSGLLDDLARAAPGLRGRIAADSPLSDITWFRVGGRAQLLVTPADEADLAYLLRHIPADWPVHVIGLGSNLLVRDGALPGIVIRLGRGFADVAALDGNVMRLGAAVPDAIAARAAADVGIAGLSFYRGIPGSIGGAVRMNAGAHGSETKDVLIEARAVDRRGMVHVLSAADMGMRYRHSEIPAAFIITQATFQGRAGSKDEIVREMNEVARYREQHQPINERTGGSTFKNPPGHSAWKLIDDAGCRGLRVGGAVVSPKHCNFLINEHDASAEDIERLGEMVRARVFARSGIALEWEIIRLGLPLPGHAMGPDLVARA